MLDSFRGDHLEIFSNMLAENNQGRVIKEELSLFYNEYESSGRMIEKQKDFVTRYLEKELLDL